LGAIERKPFGNLSLEEIMMVFILVILACCIEGMGGGNSFAQMLAIFTNQEGVYRFTTEEVVGGKYAYRISKLTNVENGKIYLSTETCPEPPQGLCDNPKKGRAVFTFNKGNLKEL
jgi:hypothetical protein